MATIVNYKNVVRGDVFTFNITYKVDGVATDITGFTFRLTVREYQNTDTLTSLTDDSTATISKVVTTHVDAVNGETVIELTAAETTIQPGRYRYDIQFTDTTGAIVTPQLGDFLVISDYTRAS